MFLTKWPFYKCFLCDKYKMLKKDTWTLKFRGVKDIKQRYLCDPCSEIAQKVVDEYGKEE